MIDDFPGSGYIVDAGTSKKERSPVITLVVGGEVAFDVVAAETAETAEAAEAGEAAGAAEAASRLPMRRSFAAAGSDDRLCDASSPTSDFSMAMTVLLVARVEMHSATSYLEYPICLRARQTLDAKLSIKFTSCIHSNMG